MASVQFQNLSTSLSVKRDCDYPSIFQDVDMKVIDKKLGPIASLSAVKISRSDCRGSFLSTLDGHSEDLHHFSVELFDNYGRVHPWLIEPGSRSGTGCWGKELNDGQLVFIMKISVMEKYRGKGIGSFTLKKFVASEHVNKTFDTVLCWPTPELSQVTSDSELKKLKGRQVAFFRKAGSSTFAENGFRRVGRTEIFGYSPEATHPSHSISVAHDANEKGEEFENTDMGLSIDEIRKKYPLHTAIFSVKKQEMDVAGTIRKHYQLDPTSIHQPNSLGYTPIHAALMTANLEAVRVFLELGVTEDLNNSNNVECRTPLEALESVMLSSRQVASEAGGHWKGYNDDELTCEFLVKRAMGKSTMADTLVGYIAKRKWGCTCGACAGGWLSKSMRSDLSMVTYETLDISECELETFLPRVQHRNPDALILIRDFPPELLRSVSLTFYTGCQAIFEAVLKFLDETQEPLSVAAILERTSNDKSVKPFFKKGGKVEHVLDSITQWAMTRKLKGDMESEEYWIEELGSIIDSKEREWDGPCANDLEFSLVRQHLGLGAIILL